jgi:hypothetical protein
MAVRLRVTVKYLGRSVVVLVAAIVLTSCTMGGGRPWSWSARRLVPDASALDAIACPTSTGCVALLADATSVDLTGTTWSAPIPIEDAGRSDAPDGLACVRPTWCVAIDGLNQVLAYDGHRWSKPVRIEPVSKATVDVISCASTTFCVVGDENGDASIYNGKGWSTPTPVADSSGLAGLSCPSAGVCFAVDAESSEVFRYDHGRWSISAELTLSTPQGGSEPNSLDAISCGSRSFCVALDDFGEAFSYDGKWSGAHTFDDIQDEDAELSCTPSLTCVAVDDSDDVVIDQAGAWSSPRHLGRSNAILQDVACAPQSRCVVIDDKGGYFVGHAAGRPA